MEIARGLDTIPRRPSALALGTFDGLHRGHQALLQETRRVAREEGGAAAAITFDPHPLTVVAPPPEPFLLTTLAERLALVEDQGLDLVIVIHFDEAFRQTGADAWLDLLRRSAGMRHLLCGPNYTFGRDRGGDVALLQRWAQGHDIRVHVVPPVHVGGVVVSSTLIRRLLRSGEVREAARYLGRWYALRGTVQRGDGRGARLGFPTANLALPEDKLLPATGIYAAYAQTERGVHQAAVSIGTRPTYGPGAMVVEAYLLDFAADLYGEPVELRFVQRLRDEIAFTSEEALVRQIREDVEETRRLLESVGDPA